tara:strand:+ start:2063 stop:2407 length:345 start_codon:yes stop_codon:yes gene_type:complete
MRKSYATGMSKHKTLETGRKKADNTSTYNTGRKKHSSIKTGRLRISMYGGRPSKTLYVLRHLEEHGSITSWDAIKLYNATRLSGIIFTLKQQGYVIETSGGQGNHYATYHLISE